ncbi:class I SAM-dependent rRNA methyltransferase [Culturomica massiliensis]|jgi:23S rRNA (cytosine1962-C5)-methyltransferase|uniref:class I SAM-dependent rRNA methyltransferase n=1 Tax=Culturomica massiliensis TaxID=1841857 RepID=UPI000E55BEFA|nr:MULTISPECIES: class I SAM-dependent rRNA methyltransferase [Odoribacteraceae]RHV94725.1 class I SAM-dependent rRNA methyltransferase [Odoribacter sp. OF09-27XD]
MNSILLKSGKEKSVFRYHPWIFSGAIAKTEGTLQEGDIVKVYSADRQFLAIGHYQIGSIAVRILSFEDTVIDHNFWRTRITEAYRKRRSLGLTDSQTNNVYRLIHGEGDNLPGLVVDIYANVAVTQFHSVGMYLERENIAKAIVEVLGDQITAIYDKSESTLPFKAAIEPKNGYLYGQAKSFIALENGLKFNVDWLEGQKTGFFIDQRENRSLLEKYARDKSVLNMFCYTGGFSFYAMRGGAHSVHSVDVSARAIELARQNVELNFPGDPRHEAFAKEAFRFLEHSYDKYDLIILDPPAFAKHQNVLNNAIQGYKKLNRKGIEVIKPGGIIFTFSCSQVMTKELFRQTVFTAAANTGRKVSILHQLTQPADHPINIYHPEGEYLKGLVLYVE